MDDCVGGRTVKFSVGGGGDGRRGVVAVGARLM